MLPDDMADLFRPIYRAPAPPPHQPGIHALIVGISRYPNLPLPGHGDELSPDERKLGLEQLTCAARSAWSVHNWLLQTEKQLPLPLLSIRTLLSLSDDENREFGADSLPAHGASLERFQAAANSWRADLSHDPDHVALFYYAGHGFQRKRSGDLVMLLEGTGGQLGGRLAHSIEASHLVGGMAPSQLHPRIARKQVYLFDACRMPLTDGYKYEDEPGGSLWDIAALGEFEDDRLMPRYYTTRPGASAYGLPDNLTLFSRALLRCFDGSAAEFNTAMDRWEVTAASLSEAFNRELIAVSEDEKIEAKQKVQVDGLGEPLTLVKFPTAPEVEVSVSVDPASAVPATKISIGDFMAPPRDFGPPLDPHPLRVKLPMGSYRVSVTSDGLHLDCLRNLNARESVWRLELDE